MNKHQQPTGTFRKIDDTWMIAFPAGQVQPGDVVTVGLKSGKTKQVQLSRLTHLYGEGRDGGLEFFEEMSALEKAHAEPKSKAPTVHKLRVPRSRAQWALDQVMGTAPGLNRFGGLDLDDEGEGALIREFESCFTPALVSLGMTPLQMQAALDRAKDA